MCASVKESSERGAVVCVGGVCFSEGSCVHGVMWERGAVVRGWCASVRESCVCSCVHGVMWERGAVVCVGGVLQ